MQADLLADSSREAQDVLLVDIGGGHGHDLEKFSRRFGNAPGRLVLQDLPLTLDGVGELDARIELFPHNFFNAQPIKGSYLPCPVWRLKRVLTFSVPRRSCILHTFRLPQLG